MKTDVFILELVKKKCTGQVNPFFAKFFTPA